jgi:hypothetical protein
MNRENQSDDILFDLKLKGVVVDPPFLGVDVGFTELVEFEDGETREVSVHLLEAL